MLKSRNPHDTEKIALALAKNLRRGLLCLYGELGTGKTTFVRGIAKGFGIRTRVQSPTFTYERIYGTRPKLYHFDCYRIIQEDPLLLQSFQEAIERHDGLVVVEWADRISEFLPPQRIDVYFEYVDEYTRKITIYNDYDR